MLNFKLFKEKRKSFPISMAFEPVQLCNARCFCCPYTFLREQDGYKNKRMNRKNIEELIRQFGEVRIKYDYKGILKLNPFRFSDPLICKDLDLILKIAAEYNIKIVITTNGIGLTKKNLELLEKYNKLISKISISLIGSTPADIKELMGINHEIVKKNLNDLSKNYSILCSMTRVSLRILRGSQEELDSIKDLRKFFEARNITIAATKEQWLTNRINNKDFKVENSKPKEPMKMDNRAQSKSKYVNGCGWKPLFNRIEVMVDGSVVLCCDDAEKNKVFGNVFDEGIDQIWNTTLKREHELIINKQFSENKNNLICGTCSRAKWQE